MTNKPLDLESITCLMIDDDKFSRTFIKTALYQIGIKSVKEAASAREAMEQLANYKIDLILLDQVMPEKSGIEFVQYIKKISANGINTIPIIMITVDTKEKTVLDAKNLGIKEYVVKPISPIALKKRICSVFGIKERA